MGTTSPFDWADTEHDLLEAQAVGFWLGAGVATLVALLAWALLRIVGCLR